MKYLLYFTFFFGFLQSTAQVAYNVDSVLVWRDASIGADGSESVYNEVWGFSRNGREYAVLGSRAGAYLVDITNVKNPNLITFIPGAYDQGINRDYHDYNGYLYLVCDQGESSLQIVDLHFLPDSAPIVYDSNELLTRCHNIFIDTNTAHLYACSATIKDSLGNNALVDLQIYDLSNSHIPELLLTFDRENIDAFHDIYVKNDTAIGNNGNTGLFFYDFSDLTNPTILNSITSYAEQGYNHAGYTSADGTYYYFSDETKATDLKAVFLDDYIDPEVVDLFNAGRNEDQTVAHNLLVRDNLLFVSYYHEGLQIYNLDKPAKPRKVGHYQTFTRTEKTSPNEAPTKDYRGFDGAWGVYPYLPSGYILVSDRRKGLFVFDISQIDGNHHAELYVKKLVFPNPMSNYVELVYPYDRIEKIELFDLNGRLVQKPVNLGDDGGITFVYFDNNLQSGWYIMKVEGSTEAFTVRLLKE